MTSPSPRRIVARYLQALSPTPRSVLKEMLRGSSNWVWTLDDFVASLDDYQEDDGRWVVHGNIAKGPRTFPAGSERAVRRALKKLEADGEIRGVSYQGQPPERSGAWSVVEKR
jgi:hypothetical protein